jgi:putative inorganic carbon (HCO3(-)) transporter
MNPPKITQYPTISTAATVVFCLLVVSWWLEVGLRVAFLGSIRWEFLLAALASVIAMVRHSAKGKNPRAGGPAPGGNSDIIRCIVLILVVHGLSLPLAIDFDIAWDAYINRVVKYAILGLLVSHFVISPGTLRTYLFASLVAFLKIGQEAFLGKMTGNMIWENQGVPRLFGTQGSMFGHPNSLSGKTVSMLPFIWYLYPTIEARWVRMLVLLQVIFAINIIVFTASRTGYLTFIAATILIVAFSRTRKLRMVGFAIGLSVVAMAFVPQQYKERFTSAFTGEEKEGHSADTRLGLLLDSIKAFSENPLGVGAECFPIYQARGGRNAQETHNLYTQILAETGVQGFICFVALLYVILRKALRIRRRLIALIDHLVAFRKTAPPQAHEAIETELKSGRLFYAATSAVIVFTLVRLILGLFGHDLYEIYWWFAAGLTMALQNMSSIAEQRCGEIAGVPATLEDSKANRAHRFRESRRRVPG